MKELDILGDENACPTIAFLKNGRLLIGLRHYNLDKWKTVSLWTLPGGRCETGETLEVALRREVAEEVGIVDFHISEFLGAVPGAKIGDIVYVFVGETKQKPRLMEPEKFSEWSWVDMDKVPANFINNDALELLMKKCRG